MDRDPYEGGGQQGNGQGWAVGPFYLGVRPPPVEYSTFNQAVNVFTLVRIQKRGFVTGPNRQDYIQL